jgi:hypothetical protein
MVMIGIEIHEQHAVEGSLFAILFVICAIVWLLADPQTLGRRDNAPSD